MIHVTHGKTAYTCRSEGGAAWRGEPLWHPVRGTGMPEGGEVAITRAIPFHPGLLILLVLVIAMFLSSCAPGGQQQAQPDPRLKEFHIGSARIILLDNNAEVDGTLQNTGHDPFPFDVTITATFYDGAGHVVGHAQGVAEDVFPGMTRPFVLLGQVDSVRYSRMQLTPVSLRERRYEKGLPTPPPLVP